MKKANNVTELTSLLSEAEAALEKLMDSKRVEAEFAKESKVRFDKNLAAFTKYYPKIAETIQSYPVDPDFKIVISPSGAPNFKPKSAGVPLYGDDPVAQVREQVEQNSKKGYYSHTRYGYALSTKDDRVHIRYMTELSSLLAKAQEQQPVPFRALTSHFPSAMIFGIGLGYHISMLLESHSFDYIFICEPDLEVFYASLFCTDWFEIIEKVDTELGTLFFQIGVSYQEFFEEVYRVAADIGAFSLVRSFCYQHYPSAAINAQIKEFFERYYQFQFGFGFFNDAITGIAHATSHIRSKQNFFLAKNLKKYYTDIPVCVVGNGPSLDKSLEFLKEHQNDLIIIAAGSALSTLYRYGIDADFHALVERTKTTYDANLQMVPVEYYKRMNLLTVDVMYPEITELYKWSGIGLKGPEAASLLIQYLFLRRHGMLLPSMPYSGPVVANLALSYAVKLGFKEIYLFGVDNGSYSDQTHSKFSIYYDKKFEKYTTPLSAKLRHTLKGNFGVDVMSNEVLVAAKSQMESLIKPLKKTVSFYNVGFGAALEGAYALREEQLLPPKKLTDKNAVVEEIKADYFAANLFDFEESDLCFEQFDEMCDHLVSIASVEINTRKDACEILKKQSRYIYSFRSTKYAFLFHMIKGSLLYYHCPLITLLYSYEDDVVTLDYFRDAIRLWNNYVTEIKHEYRNDWNKNCDIGLDKWRELNG